jgi:tRNA (guanosine-2'-O-)-methyltransferase
MEELRNMDKNRLQELVDYLTGFVSKERAERIESVLGQRTRHINIVLEDLYQPHNASAVMRSCDAFGVQDLYVIENEHRFSPHTRITLGAEKWLTVKRFRGEDALGQCLGNLKEEGYMLVATSPKHHHPAISEIPVDQKISLMFGAELTGLSDQAFKRADLMCRIPMRGFTESFNVSVSAAICMYELTNRVRQSVEDWPLAEDQKRVLRYLWLKKSIRAGDQLVADFLKSPD